LGVAWYFDPAPLLWISSLGICVLVGIALNLATHQAGQARDFWVVFRLFLIPFCISSCSAFIKGKGFGLLPAASSSTGDWCGCLRRSGGILFSVSQLSKACSTLEQSDATF
jgi:hypothetical protein